LERLTNEGFLSYNREVQLRCYRRKSLELDTNIDVLFSLDVSSTSTGYSIIKKGRFRKVNKYFGKIMPDKKLDLAEKLSYFRSELVKLLEKYKPTCVAIEDVFVGRVNSAIILSRFSGVDDECIKQK